MDVMKRVLSLLLALVLLLGNIPAAAFAEETEIPAETEIVAAEETLAPAEAATEPETPTEVETEPVEETLAPTEAAAEPATEPAAEETIAPTQPAVPEETSAPTEPVAEETVAPTEPVEETIPIETCAPTEAVTEPTPEETTAPTEEAADLLEGTVPGEDALAATSSVVASGTCGENLTWKLSKKGTLTIFGTGPMDDFDEFKTPWHSRRKTVKKVVIKDGVTTIGDYAFSYCTKLNGVVIPNSVISIGDEAFDECVKLTNIYIKDVGAWLRISCGKGVSRPCGRFGQETKLYLNGKLISNLVIPQGVTSIGAFAFYRCKSLVSVTIPDGVTSIDEAAFTYCTNLKSVNIPNSVTSIGQIAFCNCESLKSIVIPNSVVKVGDRVFSDCSSLASVEIPSSWTYISDGAFSECTSLAKVTIPNSVTRIGENSFSGCGLVDVLIPDSVTNIGEGAFAGCYSLKNIHIPASVTSIGDEAFFDCPKLEKVQLSNKLTSIGEWAFYGCKRLRSITIPASVTKIKIWAFGSCDKLGKIIFLGDAPDILKEAFLRVTATVYYPVDNPTWSSSMKKNYGGTLKWVGKCTNHSLVILPGVAPTCTTDGVVEGSYCAKCNEIIAAQEVLPALGHDIAQWEIFRETTYTVAGERHGNCERCGELVVEALDALGLPKPVVTVAANEKTGGGTLSWEHDGEADYYKVYRATSKSGKYKLLETVEGTELEVKVGAGKTYYYKVKAICEADSSLNSSYSSVVKVTGKCAQPEINVTAKPSSGKPVVKWSKVSSAKKYDVYRATEIDGTYKKVKTTTSTSYTDSKAKLGVTYYYKVKAIASKSTYNSAYSEIKSCLTILAQPEAELSINKTTGKPVIEWEEVSGAIGYDILRAESEKGEYTKLANQTELTFTDSTAEPDKDYWYKVNAIAENPALNSIDVTGHQQTVHSTLAQPKVTFGINSISGKPVLTWEEVDGAVEYKIYRSTSSKKSYKAIATTTDTEYIATSASVGKGYYYKVIAIGENCKSSYSSYKKLTAKCAQPEINVTAKPSSGKPYVDWEKVSGAEKYYVYRATEIDGEYEKVKSTTKTAYTDSKAKLGVTYYYKVKAVASKSTYNSIYSEVESCLTVLARPVVTAKNDADTGKVILNWEKVDGAVAYEVYRMGEDGILCPMRTQWELAFTDEGEGTEVDTVYTYTVKAIAEYTKLNSAESAAVTTSATCEKPKASIELISKKPSISWDNVEGATKYYVYRSTKKSSGYKKVATVELEDGTSYRDSKAKKGTTYYYKIVAVSENTKSAYSSVVKIKSK